MAEPAAAGGFDPRRLLLVGGVVAVVIFSVLFFLFRGCSAPGAPGVKKPGYTVIYSNLDLKDAANVIARLKELNIEYEIRDDGRAVSVPKDKSDQARLGLAEKNLPLGGVVGWEIFDEARLGATDFDRRIQLIRAISGELCRTIRRIAGVEDARVQVVIPETKLFAATVAPVTASVMLRLRPGFNLAAEKINGIIHLVASSVENLQPENVTVVDDSGRILTAKLPEKEIKLAPLPPPPAETLAVFTTPEAEAAPSTEVVISKEKPAAVTKEAVAKAGPVTREALVSREAVTAALLTKAASLTAEERIRLKSQAKKEIEQELSGKAQELLNRFYPINSVIVKVGVEISPAKDGELRAKDLKIRKLNTIVLVDNRIDFSPNLKQATFTTVAAAIGHNKKRGDTIILQRVPFHLATPPVLMFRGEAGKAQPESRPSAPALITPRRLMWVGGAALVLLTLFWIVGLLRRSRLEMGPSLAPETTAAPPPYARERGSKLDQMKGLADQNPERIAELLKKWLSE